MVVSWLIAVHVSLCDVSEPSAFVKLGCSTEGTARSVRPCLVTRALDTLPLRLQLKQGVAAA
jgi:hypothetical protein